MKRLRVHGQREPLDLKSATPDFPGNLKDLVTLKHSARVQGARAGQPPLEIDDLSSDDLIQLELDQGIKLWVRADDLERDFGLTPSRGSTGDVVELPLALPLGTPSRGIVGNWVIKGFKVFGLDPVGATTDLIKDKVEGVMKPGPGLYRWEGKESSDYTRIKSLAKEKTDTPWLVFIHGTASSTEGSFGGLWEGGANARMVQLLGHYPKRVLAFQHRTLSQNPIQNALDLAGYFPEGARLHLVSHSRGGLVGELLCRSIMEGRFSFDQDDFQVFAQPDRKDDLKQLEQLGHLLQQKQLIIERFVRVGCPARGTTLASGRLDRYLSIILNVVEAIPGLKGNPVLEGLSAFLLGVVKNRTKPEELPGLEAQMPTSPLVRILNRPGIRSMADLHILGGDVAGEGVLGRLKTFVTDLFYREDHDLVVNTPAMFGGTERTGEVQYWIDTGKEVDHFHYFRNPDTANRLMQALTKDAPHSLFHRLEREPSEVTEDDYRKRAVGSPQPVVYVLPGTMGSQLKVGNDRVWLDKLDLAFGGLKKLKYTAKNVEADQPIGSGYKDLIKYLANSHTVKPFAYDWRKSLVELADRFRKDLEETVKAQEAVGQPVRIIAHSMGGLVVRVMMATEEGKKVWDRMCRHPGARFIMLGTPNEGSHAITGMLMGRDPLVRMLDLLDITNSQTTLLGIISRFDGVLQLLPHTGTLDVYQVETWRSLLEHDRDRVRGLFGAKVATSKTAGIEWPVPDAAQLADAFKVQRLLQDSPIDSQRMIYVAGRADATPCDVSIDLSDSAERRIRIDATPFGDGRVPWDTGIPEALKHQTYYMDSEHGDLANAPEAFDALLDLLNAGVTTKLSQVPLVRRGVSVVPFELPEVRLEMYPNEEDLIASALGSARIKKKRQPTRKISVTMVHGNLSRASSPVAVGHYEGDTIVSAEAYLDRQLNGRLRERQCLGLYPDKLNTSAVVLTDGDCDQERTHPGAIVVGLGMVGDLTPGGLTSTMADAVVNYALKCIEVERKRRSATAVDGSCGPRLNIPLTMLLIGTGAGGLSLIDSLQSLLRGILQANRRLDKLERTETPESEGQTADDDRLTGSIETVEILELYQDLAIQATKSLLELGRSRDFREHFNIHEVMVEGVEGRRRASFDEDAGWWQRLRIAIQEDGSLKFEALTNRARAETYLQPAQRKLIERFLERAMATTQNDLELSSTLFELIIPNRMKEYAPDRRSMVLVLDEKSAAYPWELLHNRFDPNSRPLAVEAGMVRQMAVPQFREKVLHGTALNALVIGDPTSHEPLGKFSPLPGAAREAREVAQLIRHQEYREVVELVEGDATPDAILTALYQQPYRIVHCAAHGVFEFPIEEELAKLGIPGSQRDPGTKPKTVTGMVLGEGLFLTPAEINQMRYVPELVFLNCCHLGQTKGSAEQSNIPFHQLASNLGTQLIRMGVRAVVAAGWAVDDLAAKTFAKKFYEEMFQNRTFGDAVRLAREEIFLRQGGSNTWGAYQCYGDPDFSLHIGAKSIGRERRMVAPVELREELYNLVQEAKTAEPKDEARLRRRLQELTAGVGQGWTDSAAMCAALGLAYGELGLFAEAVRFYDRGRTLQPADATVESLEQLANLKVRWALDRVERQGDPTAQTLHPIEKDFPIQDLFDDAENILAGLLTIQPTQERYALKGKLYKGKAMLLTTKADQRKALLEMKRCYDEAYTIGKAVKRNDAYYPLENRLAAEIVLSWDQPKGRQPQRGKKKGPDPITEGLADLATYAKNFKENRQSFWDISLPPDQKLLEALYAQRMTGKDQKEIGNGYLEAKRRGGSAREMDSVIKHIRFFELMVATQAPPSIRQQLSAGLKTLRVNIVSDDGGKGV
ncbi:MAG TPA: CHAT domain-containing protein [Nitrospirales bacterium]|nr:CHAT domain-containing protein [Nitrospirales bacterium]